MQALAGQIAIPANFSIDNRFGQRQNFYQLARFLPMPTSCKHPQVRVVAREEDVEFVECQVCGEVFDSAEFVDILNEEDPATESAIEEA
jgi:rRNA maturation protein Nop10